MSHQHRQSPKQQLSDFGEELLQAGFVTAVAMFIMAAVFFPSLSNYGVTTAISEAIGEEAYMPFLVTSWFSLSLYLTSNNVGPESDDDGSDAEDTAEEVVDVEDKEFLEIMKKLTGELFKVLSQLGYLSLLVVVGSLISAYVTSHIAPIFGILIAIGLPVLEIKISSTAFWFLSPSTVLVFPTSLALVPVSVVIVALAFTIGMLLAVSQTLKSAIKIFLTWMVGIFQVSNVDIPTLDPFKQTFNRRGRH